MTPLDPHLRALWEPVRGPLAKLCHEKGVYNVAGMLNNKVGHEFIKPGTLTDAIRQSNPRPVGPKVIAALDAVARDNPSYKPGPGSTWTELHQPYATRPPRPKRAPDPEPRPDDPTIGDGPKRRVWGRRAKVGAAIAGVAIVGAVVSTLLLGGDERPAFDFEQTTQGWGEHPESATHTSGDGVSTQCGETPRISVTGRCSLRFAPRHIARSSAYVTVVRDVAGHVVRAHVAAPRGQLCAAGRAAACSTAKLIVWDADNTSHESGYTELGREWRPVSFDVRHQSWPAPWREVGIHFYFVGRFRGPVFVDSVTIR